MIAFSIAIVTSIYYARSDKEVFIRRIPGLEAVDEAIGRATEMGRSILYVLGLGSVNTPATIASMNILGQVARRTADYENAFARAMQRSDCDECRTRDGESSLSQRGTSPMHINEDTIFFLTDSQFAYAAGVDGIMLREKTGSDIFYKVTFYAESLILAETGNSIGAIQIAGTDSEHQLPFLITACDYTLIGEELYTASAYLSKETDAPGQYQGTRLGKSGHLRCNRAGSDS